MSNLNYEACMAFKEKSVKTAIDKITQLLKATPDDAVALSNLGVFQKAAGQHWHALTSLTKSLSINSNRALTYWNRGNVHLDMGMFDEALHDYKACLELDPKFEDAQRAKEEIEHIQHPSRTKIEPKLKHEFS